MRLQRLEGGVRCGTFTGNEKEVEGKGKGRTYNRMPHTPSVRYCGSDPLASKTAGPRDSFRKSEGPTTVLGTLLSSEVRNRRLSKAKRKLADSFSVRTFLVVFSSLRHAHTSTLRITSLELNLPSLRKLLATFTVSLRKELHAVNWACSAF